MVTKSFFQGIAYRLAKIGVILGVLLGLIMGSVQLYVDYLENERQLNALINRVVEAASPPATRSVHTLDRDLAAEVVNGMLAYDFIFQAAIYDEVGTLLAENSKQRTAYPASWWAGFFMEDVTLHSAPLAIPDYGGTTQGRLTFKVDVSSALNIFYKRSSLVLVIGLVRHGILVLLLLVVFYYLLARPLIRMASEFRQIQPDNPGSRRITVPNPGRGDELTQLALSSNQMLDAIDSAFNQRLAVEQALIESETLFRMIVGQLPAMVGVLNLDGSIKFANQKMAQFFGETEDDIVGLNVFELGYGFGELRSVKRAAAGKVPGSEPFEGYFSATNGERHYLQGYVNSIVLSGESYVLFVANDLTDRKEAEEKMAYMAFHDDLTDLPNRVHLVNRLESEIHRARRHHYHGAVLFIDLDHFKNINDSLGHPVGDQILKQVAGRLRGLIRQEDLVARLGGDEFVVVLTVLDQEMETAGKKAGEVAEKIRRALSIPYAYKDMKLHLACSIGVVVYSDNEHSVHELLRFADTAMYQVKSKGRNAIEFFNLDMANRVSNYLQMESELYKAAADNQFELYFQPQVDVNTGVIQGAEALLRWQHPLRGRISPAEFVPVLEASGLMLDVGRWVIEEGCRVVNHLDRQGLWREGMRLSVNISPRQFRGQNFVDEITTILQEIPIPANSLDLEITEGVVIQNVEETIATMSALSAKGINFYLDDFGTGYSSISYLKRLPVSTLKIDHNFVRDIVDDRNDRVLVETMVTMGQLLDMSVVAEGVESKAQLDVLAAFGCDSYQGYYFSEPLPLREFQTLLEHEKEGLLAVDEVVVE